MGGVLEGPLPQVRGEPGPSADTQGEAVLCQFQGHVQDLHESAAAAAGSFSQVRMNGSDLVPIADGTERCPLSEIKMLACSQSVFDSSFVILLLKV